MSYLLSCKAAEKLYSAAKNLPIIDYHCHLVPKEIYEDRVFSNIGEMWLGADHYKWRLMRCAGIDEKYITGDASYEEKFIKYIECLSMAAGNPLYAWSKMELEIFFGITLPILPENAAAMWNEANRVIKEKQLSPRKLIEMSNVKYIGTTDDVCDTLEYHKLIAEDNLSAKVAPSFRTDKLLLINADGYTSYLSLLEERSGIKITDLASFKAAVEKRLQFFCKNDCRISDVGIECFPTSIGTDEQADAALKAVIAGGKADEQALSYFLGNMYVFLGKLYKKYNILMQLHMAVKRNASTALFKLCGPDSGGDCINDEIPANAVIAILDAIELDGGLPQTVVYNLNPSMASKLNTICGSFRNVRLGTSWWFCDHKRGIEDQINVIAETGHLGSFLGMLTDSRSFLSYARHDYFRRLQCSVIGEWIERGEYDDTLADKLMYNICCGNIAKLLGVTL
ncbi:MAG: glucuronate isomerase [Oscillospiraceae bacterium]|nr:glucuronate isomerase [Oscillospiraceae bacterium]